MKIKRKPAAPSDVEGAILASLKTAGINGMSSRQLGELVEGHSPRMRKLMDAGMVRTEWTPCKDHPYAVQEARWWFVQKSPQA